tara:strand:+ start:118 stop:1080 length:963 start_codon:yes stop_codon:yes gene_type:complete
MKNTFLRQILISFIIIFIVSCIQKEAENKKIEHISTNISLQKLSLVSSDSLSFKITYSNPNNFNALLLFKDDENILSKTEIIQDTTEIVYQKVFFPNDLESISARLVHSEIENEVFSFDIPKLINQNITIVSDNQSIFKKTLSKNKLFEIEELKVNNFIKYDFTESDILILEDINFYSDYLIEAIQKFILSKKKLIIFMTPNLNQSIFLSQTLSFPEIKAVRGTSKNQYFEILEKSDGDSILKNNSQAKIFKFIDVKNFDNNIDYSLSTNDPLIIKKNILGSNTIFITTLLKDDWVNESFNDFIYDIFLDFIYDEIVINE